MAATSANSLQRLVLLGAAAEAFVMLAALALRGLPAMAAALIGSSIAMGAQIAAVVLLRPAMGASQAVFQQRWVLGMAVRFASFLALAVLLFALQNALPITYMAAGYLCTLLVMLFAETRFLR
jgi:hypothetical protein